MLHAQLRRWEDWKSLASLPTALCFCGKIKLHPLKYWAMKSVGGDLCVNMWRTKLFVSELFECLCAYVRTCNLVSLGTYWLCSPINKSIAGCLPSVIIICCRLSHTFGLNREQPVSTIKTSLKHNKRHNLEQLYFSREKLSSH